MSRISQRLDYDHGIEIGNHDVLPNKKELCRPVTEFRPNDDESSFERARFSNTHTRARAHTHEFSYPATSVVVSSAGSRTRRRPAVTLIRRTEAGRATRRATAWTSPNS